MIKPMTIARQVLWTIAALLALFTGLYPIQYLSGDGTIGLLQQKGGLVNNPFWKAAFYTHLLTGGLALLIGWTQFSSWLRRKAMRIHRVIGQVYVISALVSSVTGIYIGFYALGGWISIVGFVCLGFIWFYTTLQGYRTIVQKDVAAHQKMITYSYAACFAGVMLRLWLPLFSALLGNFVIAYAIVAWLCWVPNMAVAYYVVKRIESPVRSLAVSPLSGGKE